LHATLVKVFGAECFGKAGIFLGVAREATFKVADLVVKAVVSFIVFVFDVTWFRFFGASFFSWTFSIGNLV